MSLGNTNCSPTHPIKIPFPDGTVCPADENWTAGAEAAGSASTKLPQLSRLFSLPTGASIFGGRTVGAEFGPLGEPTIIQYNVGSSGKDVAGVLDASIAAAEPSVMPSLPPPSEAWISSKMQKICRILSTRFTKMRPPKWRTSGASKQTMLITPPKLAHDRLVGIALVGDASSVRNDTGCHRVNIPLIAWSIFTQPALPVIASCRCAGPAASVFVTSNGSRFRKGVFEFIALKARLISTVNRAGNKQST